jgi:hypothetical protein
MNFQSIASELMISDGEVKASILFKVHRRGNWGESHTAFDSLQKGFKDTDPGKHGEAPREASKRTDSTGVDSFTSHELRAAGVVESKTE